jgi:hypothetical protein
MNNSDQLIKLINRFIELDNIDDYYFHRNYNDGSLELNITFKDYSVSNKIEEEFKIKEIDASAYWE